MDYSSFLVMLKTFRRELKKIRREREREM